MSFLVCLTWLRSHVLFMLRSVTFTDFLSLFLSPSASSECIATRVVQTVGNIWDHVSTHINKIYNIGLVIKYFTFSHSCSTVMLRNDVCFQQVFWLYLALVTEILTLLRSIRGVLHVFTEMFSEVFKGQKPAAICGIVGYLHLLRPLLFDISMKLSRGIFTSALQILCSLVFVRPPQFSDVNLQDDKMTNDKTFHRPIIPSFISNLASNEASLYQGE